MTSLKLGGYDPLDAQLDEAAIVHDRSDASARACLWPRGRRHRSPSPRCCSPASSSVPAASACCRRARYRFSIQPYRSRLLRLAALVGLNLSLRGRGGRRVLGAAGLESGLAMLVVAIPFALAPPRLLAQRAIPLWILAAALGACAASSLAVPPRQTPEEPAAGSRLRYPASDSCRRSPSRLPSPDRPWAAIALIGQAMIITVLLAAAVWLLLTRAASDTEQRVFVFSAMLLIGGVADYLSLSALLTGLAAGITWSFAGGEARESLRRDLLYTQHSLLVLVLVVAGAHTDFSLPSSSVAAAVRLPAYGGQTPRRCSGRATERRAPATPGLRLLSPGVFGVALALNIVRAAGSDAVVLLEHCRAGYGWLRNHCRDRPTTGRRGLRGRSCGAVVTRLAALVLTVAAVIWVRGLGYDRCLRIGGDCARPGFRAGRAPGSRAICCGVSIFRV